MLTPVPRFSPVWISAPGRLPMPAKVLLQRRLLQEDLLGVQEQLFSQKLVAPNVLRKLNPMLRAGKLRALSLARVGADPRDPTRNN